MKNNLSVAKTKAISILLAPLLMLTFCGCGNSELGSKAKNIFATGKYDEEAFAQLITNATNAPTDSLGNSSSFLDLYKEHKAALWINQDGSLSKAESLLAALKELEYDGLKPERYAVKEIEQALSKLKSSTQDWPIEVVFSADTLMSSAYAHAAHDLLMGVVAPADADEIWHHKNDSAFILKAAADSGAIFANYRSTIPTYHLLMAQLKRLKNLEQDSAYIALKQRATTDSLSDVLAFMDKATNGYLIKVDTLTDEVRRIKSFQKFFGLTQSGKMDEATTAFLHRSQDSTVYTYKANLERLRWLPRSLEATHFFVVIPKMELYVQNDGSFLTQRRVIVGKPIRATPSLSQNLANIVFNPPWGVPPTIKKNDVIPGIARRGNAYLLRKGLKAYDNRGRLVSDASVINSGNAHRFNFRQAPGASNALGNVKFNLPNKWDIYLHDTPHRGDFKSSNRALSSGCVRVQDPLDLATLVLTKMVQTDYSRSKIDSIVATRRTTEKKIEKEIPVHIVYLTAFDADFDGKHVAIYKDIYKKDKKLIALLSEF